MLNEFVTSQGIQSWQCHLAALHDAQPLTLCHRLHVQHGSHVGLSTNTTGLHAWLH